MIDQDYKGDKKNIVSQNRYTYAMNNPYRYVDRNGNAAIEPEGGGSGSGSSAGTRSLASIATHTRTTSGQHQSQTVRATTPRASVAETILTPREEPPRGNEIINTDRNTPKPDIPVIECPNDVVGDFINGLVGAIGNGIKIAAEWLIDTVVDILDSLLNLAIIVVGGIVVAAGIVAVVYAVSSIIAAIASLGIVVTLIAKTMTYATLVFGLGTVEYILIYKAEESVSSGNKLDGTPMTEEELRERATAIGIGEVLNGTGMIMGSIGYTLGNIAMMLDNYKNPTNNDFNNNEEQDSEVDFYVGPDELKEMVLMQQGMSYEVAHQLALEYYGMSPHAVYSPEVIIQYPEWFGTADKDYWGIK